MKEAANGSTYAGSCCIRSLLRRVEAPFQPVSSRQSEHSLLRMQGRAIREKKQKTSSSSSALLGCCFGFSVRSRWRMGKDCGRYSVWTHGCYFRRHAIFRLDRTNSRFAEPSVCLQSTLRTNRICDHGDQKIRDLIWRTHRLIENGPRSFHASRSHGRVGTGPSAQGRRRCQGEKSYSRRLPLDTSLSEKKSPPPPPPKPPVRKGDRVGDSQPPNVIRPATPYPPPPPAPTKDK